MYEFEIVLSRWKVPERRQSAPYVVLAKDFATAVRMAAIFCEGQRWADPKAEYEIASVVHKGLSGPKCSEEWSIPKELQETLSS